MQSQNNIKLSIIIPTLNASAYIQKVIEGIAQQNFTGYEIIILDNLSTDNTLKIIKDNFSGNNRLRIYSEKDKGIYDAMNKGIALATGTWIYFMGADDSLVNDEVFKNVSGYLNEENDMVYGNVIWMPAGKREEGEWGYTKLLHQNINHQRIFYRKSLFEKYGDYNTLYTIASDHELNIRLFCNPGIKKKYINIDIACYHANGFSADKVDEQFWTNWKTIVRKNFSPHLPGKQIYGSLKKYYWYLLGKKKYLTALRVFTSVLVHTHSVGFVKSNISYLLKSKNATRKSLQ